MVIPVWRRGAGRGRAEGASVLLTVVTDAMGFFLVPGLATLSLA